MSRLRSLAVFLLLLLVAVGLRIVEANPAVAQTAVVGAWKFDVDPGMDGTSELWQSIPPTWVTTTPQLVTAPMGGGEVPRVAVRSGHWDGQIYVMLEWADSTPDTAAARPEDFVDAAAIQFPAEAASVVPALCMGQADEAVNIWHWRADVDRPSADEFGDHVDLYQSTEDLFFTARAAGNPVAADGGTAQNLLAGGFGTLSPSEDQVVSGNGVHGDSRWTVVFSRSLQSPGDLQPTFTSDTPIDTTFAVWNGALDQRNGIKSVSSFVQLRPTGEPPPGEWARASSRRIVLVPLVGLALLAGVAVVAVRDRGPAVEDE